MSELNVMRLLESNIYRNDLKKAIRRMNLELLDNKIFFITGGLGLIGSAIVDVLLAYGRTNEIYVGARNQEEFIRRFSNYKKVVFVPYDALEEIRLDIKPDYIIHGAGLASPELYTSSPVETILSNFDGVHALLEYAKENKIERLLYISSSEVYGKKNSNDPFDENTYGEINLDNLRESYAVAKRASEMLCKAYSSEFGVDVVIVRPGHVYGPSAKKTDKRISSEFSYRAASGQSLIMKSSGLQKRSYCYSIDCAIQILTVLLCGQCSEAYNIGHDEVTTIREMATYLAKAGNIELRLEMATEEQKNAFNPMNNSSLNNNKVKALGYKDTFSVEEGLTHTVEILREIGLN